MTDATTVATETLVSLADVRAAAARIETQKP